jgi:hypothetical protein
MVVALGLVLAVILSTGSGESSPKYVPNGGGVASVITPRSAPPSSGRSEAATRTTFSPTAAASRLVGRLSLEQQVAQLFLVSLDGPSSASVAGLGKLDWAGVVFDASNFSSDSRRLGRPRRDDGDGRRLAGATPGP